MGQEVDPGRVAAGPVDTRAIGRARWALQLHRLDLPTTDEPFAAIILATADRQKVDTIQMVARVAVRSRVQVEL
jgi:hypothetical protein